MQWLFITFEKFYRFYIKKKMSKNNNNNKERNRKKKRRRGLEINGSLEMSFSTTLNVVIIKTLSFFHQLFSTATKKLSWFIPNRRHLLFCGGDVVKTLGPVKQKNDLAWCQLTLAPRILAVGVFTSAIVHSDFPCPVWSDFWKRSTRQFCEVQLYYYTKPSSEKVDNDWMRKLQVLRCSIKMLSTKIVLRRK